MRLLSIAALQTAPVFGDPAATLERLAERLPRLAGVVPHAQLVVLPELYLAAVPELLDEGDGYTERVAVELRHVHGLSYPEVAEALGRPLNTVKSDVHRGVLALRGTLGELEVAR